MLLLSRAPVFATVLTTKRLVLEPTTTAHADALAAATEASLPELRPWMPWAANYSVSSTLDFVTSSEAAWLTGDGYNFTIFHRDEVVGSISLIRGNPLVRMRDMGYWLRSDLAGRGLMTEAASAVVEYGFEAIKLHRIALEAGVANTASNRVAEKIGFRREGLVRSACFGANGYYDAYLYGLLEDDPRNRFH